VHILRQNLKDGLGRLYFGPSWQDRVDDAAWCVGSSCRTSAWGQRQPGVLPAQPVSPRPSGREKSIAGTSLLPVTATDVLASRMVEPEARLAAATTPGTIYLEFPKVHLRIQGSAYAAALRVVLEYVLR
jgi:hypothetical protein